MLSEMISSAKRKASKSTKEASNEEDDEVSALLRHQMLDRLEHSSDGRAARKNRVNPRIRGATLVHLAGKAKMTNLLNGFERRYLYSVGQHLMKYRGISEKQAFTLKEILIEAKKEGLDRKACAYGDCERCHEFAVYDPKDLNLGSLPDSK